MGEFNLVLLIVLYHTIQHCIGSKVLKGIAHPPTFVEANYSNNNEAKSKEHTSDQELLSVLLQVSLEPEK